MNMLAPQNINLEFLHKTDLCSMNELQNYVANLYDFSYEMVYELEDAPIDVQLIPTRYMVVASGWHMFEDRYYHYVLNGNEPSLYEQIMEALEQGETEEDIIDSWNEFKYYNASYNVPFTLDDREGAMTRDIVKLLNQFKLTYLVDNSESVYVSPERIVVTDWINPPFKQVW